MFSTLRLACFLCLGFAISVVFGQSPIAHALAAKSSASVFTPPMETPCIADWQGPSSHNTFSCDGEDLTEWVMKNNLWSYGIPFALALLICIPGCCCVLCCRYLCGCCGGGTRQRPGHICCGGSDLDNLSEAEKAQMYSLGCIYATKIFAIAVGMVAVAGLILNIVGGVRISMGMSEVAEAFEELVNWFLQVIGEARDGIKDSNGNYPDGFDFSMFEDAENTVRDYKQTYFSDGIETAKTPLLIGSLVPAFISVLPAILLLLPGIAALCNSRRCMPTVVVVLSFPIQLIYFFVVTLLLIVLVPVDLICNELESKPGEKSVMQWYVIPSCDAESPFQSVIDNVNEMEVDAATEGCQKLLDFCSTTMVWSVSDPERVFYCNLTNAATECRSLEDIVSKVDGMVVKTGAPETCSGNASGCTLRQCAVSCDNNDAKESAKEAVDALATAQRVMHVFETVLLPWLDCSRLVDKLLGLGPRQMCSTMRDGLTFFKDGSILIAAGCVIGMIVSLFGEKRFINPDKLLEDELARAEIFNKQVAEQQHHNPIMIIGAPTQVIDVMPPQYANAYPETTDPNYVIKAVPLVDNVDETSPQQITYATVEQPVYAPEEEAVERDVGATEMKTYETVEPTPEVVAESPQHDQKQEQVPYAYTYEGAYSAPPADRDVQEVAETTAETTEMKVYETAKPTSVEAPQTHNEEPYVPTSGETDASYDPNVPQVHTSEGPYSPTSDNENVEQV